jgi:hypothetical protein
MMSVRVTVVDKKLIPLVRSRSGPAVFDRAPVLLSACGHFTHVRVDVYVLMQCADDPPAYVADGGSRRRWRSADRDGNSHACQSAIAVPLARRSELLVEGGEVWKSSRRLRIFSGADGSMAGTPNTRLPMPHSACHLQTSTTICMSRRSFALG